LASSPPDHTTLGDLLTESRKPMAKTIAKPRVFLDAEAKRNAGGNGIQPSRAGANKNPEANAVLLYARLCPFCRKARGKI
jgi:hypothetical protein